MRLSAEYFSGRSSKDEVKKKILGLVPEKWYRAMKEAVRGKDTLWQRTPAKSAVKGHYPHTCPACAGPAYVGFKEVDCQKGCRWPQL